MHDIHVAVAKNCVENLKEEVKKGMREKAEQGIYPGRAPFGYRNNPLTRSIDIHPEKAKIVRRIFALLWTRSTKTSSMQQSMASFGRLTRPLKLENGLTVERMFELANKAHFLYLRRNTAERGELLKQYF
jgi:DNA invertase Pin-like site-specific DNA recombinase